MREVTLILKHFDFLLVPLVQVENITMRIEQEKWAVSIFNGFFWGSKVEKY
jgi:hypothetical protein